MGFDKQEGYGNSLVSGLEKHDGDNQKEDGDLGNDVLELDGLKSADLVVDGGTIGPDSEDGR